MTKYVLGVDLDNVTADYTGGLRDYMVSLGHPVESMPDPTDYDFTVSGWPFRDRSDYLDKHHDFIESGGFTKLNVMDNASDVLHRLVLEHDIHIRVITHRLLRDGTYHRAISQTTQWLDDKNIPFHDFCAISDKSSVGVDLLIDDAPSNIVPVREKGGYVAVYDQPYNRDIDGPRVMDWLDIEKFVINHKRNLGY